MVFWDLPPVRLFQRNAAWLYRRITSKKKGLVCFAFCSTPARSCSEELLAHSASVVTNNTINAAGGHQTDTHQQDAGGAGAKGGDTLAFQSLALTTSDFSVLPSAMATTSTGTSDTDRQKGMTLSERDDGKEEKPWLDFFLPATWALSCSRSAFNKSKMY